MKTYHFFKNLGLCALVASALPMFGSSGGLTKAQRLSGTAALYGGLALTNPAKEIEKLTQEAEKAAQDAEQATTLQQAQEASTQAFRSSQKSRELKDLLKIEVEKVKNLLEELKVEATESNQLTIYPIEQTNEEIAEVEKIAQNAQEAVTKALRAWNKADNAVDAKKKAASAAPVVVPAPVNPSAPAVVTAAGSSEVPVRVTYDQDDVKWYDRLLSMIKREEENIGFANDSIKEFPNFKDEKLKKIANSEAEIKRLKEIIETKAELKQIEQDRAAGMASAAPVVVHTPVTPSAPEVVTPAETVALQPAEKPEPTPWTDWYLDLPSSVAAAAKAEEPEEEPEEDGDDDDDDESPIAPAAKLIQPEEEEPATPEKKAQIKEALQKNWAMKGQLMRLAQKKPATAMAEEIEEAEEEEIIPLAEETASGENANVGSDLDDEQDVISSQRPTYTKGGALTPEGHLQRLGQRQAREEAQRRSTW